jgi:hypothetical protein
VFVGTSTAYLYQFDMNKDRTGFILYNNMTDKLVTFYFVLVVHSEVLLKNDGIYLIGETHIPTDRKTFEQLARSQEDGYLIFWVFKKLGNLQT